MCHSRVPIADSVFDFTKIIQVEFTVWKLQNFALTNSEQKFRQINILNTKIQMRLIFTKNLSSKNKIIIFSHCEFIASLLHRRSKT